MTTVLLTGFEPFDGAARNISYDAAARVAGAWDGPAAVEVAQLPVTFDGAFAALAQHMERLCPDIVIACGYAARRHGITPERVAHNWDEARIADNAGNKPAGRHIDPHGPATYLSTLPLGAICDAVQGVNVPASVSESAGSYVCNHLFYCLMQYLDPQQPVPPRGAKEALRAGQLARVSQAGFIHIGDLSLPDAVTALHATIQACLTHQAPPAHPQK